MPKMPKMKAATCSAGSRSKRRKCALPGRFPRCIFVWLAAVAVAASISLAGCGRKGPPVPPVDKRAPVKEETGLLHKNRSQWELEKVNSKHEIRNSNFGFEKRVWFSAFFLAKPELTNSHFRTINDASLQL